MFLFVPTSGCEAGQALEDAITLIFQNALTQSHWIGIIVSNKPLFLTWATTDQILETHFIVQSLADPKRA